MAVRVIKLELLAKLPRCEKKIVYTLRKTNMTGWKITIFNRIYIFIHGWFSIVMLVFWGEYFVVSWVIQQKVCLLGTQNFQPYQPDRHLSAILAPEFNWMP